MQATSKQLWAIKCMTGLNTQNLVMSKDMASSIIGDIKNGVNPADYESELRSAGAVGVLKKSTGEKTQEFKRIISEATEAAESHDYSSVPFGGCGFVSVEIAGNTAFGRWAKKNKIFTKTEGISGLKMFVFEYDQCMSKNEIYARKFAESLNKNGIKATVKSRMD